MVELVVSNNYSDSPSLFYFYLLEKQWYLFGFTLGLIS